MDLATLNTLYYVSTALGFGYMLFGILMGQLGQDDSGVAGHDHTHFLGHDTGSHAAIGHDTGAHGVIGHDTGAHGVIGHGTGGHGAIGQHGTGGHDAVPQHTGGDEATAIARQATAITHPVKQSRNPLVTLWGWINPMSTSIFLCFFGLAGIIGMHLPFLGYLTLIPAVLGGLVMRAIVMQAMKTFIAKSHVSTASKVEEAIGHQAEVCTLIIPGRTGEITYVLGSKRYNMPARMNKEEGEFKRGSKVIICDVRDGVVFVEPWQDLHLN